MSTNFSTPDDVGRYLEASWYILVVLLSLLGNIFVLVASVRDRAIRLDRISIVLIENLAVADIGLCVFWVLPKTVLILKYGDPSESMCSLLYQILAYTPGSVCSGINCLLLPCLNFCKLLSLRYPLRIRSFRYRDGYKIAIVLWITEALFMTVSAFKSQIFILVHVCLSMLLLLVVVSTVALLLTVHKVRGLSRQGVFSIIFVSVVYLLCYIPISLVVLLTDFSWDNPLLRISSCVYFICCFYNPIVYYLTLKSFKEYVSRVFQRSCTPRKQAADGQNR